MDDKQDEDTIEKSLSRNSVCVWSWLQTKEKWRYEFKSNSSQSIKIIEIIRRGKNNMSKSTTLIHTPQEKSKQINLLKIIIADTH